MILLAIVLLYGALVLADIPLTGKVMDLYVRKHGLSAWLSAPERSAAHIPCGAIYVWLRYSKAWKALPDHPDAMWLFPK